MKMHQMKAMDCLKSRTMEIVIANVERATVVAALTGELVVDGAFAKEEDATVAEVAAELVIELAVVVVEMCDWEVTVEICDWKYWKKFAKWKCW